MTILKLKKKKKNFKKADAKKHYFTKDTQDAILQFQKLTSVEEKHLLYHDKIETAFYVLVDNLIITNAELDSKINENKILKYKLDNYSNVDHLIRCRNYFLSKG